jgi:hypothetical protein
LGDTGVSGAAESRVQKIRKPNSGSDLPNKKAARRAADKHPARDLQTVRWIVARVSKPFTFFRQESRP